MLTDPTPNEVPLVRLSVLQKLCKLYGRMKCGDTMMAWDYLNNVALPEAELRKDKARWAASERARYGVLPNDAGQPCAELAPSKSKPQ
jgi:hypothetical protein